MITVIKFVLYPPDYQVYKTFKVKAHFQSALMSNITYLSPGNIYLNQNNQSYIIISNISTFICSPIYENPLICNELINVYFSSLSTDSCEVNVDLVLHSLLIDGTYYYNSYPLLTDGNIMIDNPKINLGYGKIIEVYDVTAEED
jgi:hypothetical protein